MVSESGDGPSTYASRYDTLSQIVQMSVLPRLCLSVVQIKRKYFTIIRSEKVQQPNIVTHKNQIVRQTLTVSFELNSSLSASFETKVPRNRVRETSKSHVNALGGLL